MSSATPPTPIAGTILSTGSDAGTPLDWFDLNMATLPGASESTRLGQLAKALAYWTAIAGANVADSETLLKAGYAVTWLTAEIARVSTPPPNSLRVVYPV